MSNIADEIEQRTNLAMSNQLEMLTFYLSDDQLYGINVFKIIEVLECPPKITKMPNSHQAVKGTINFRGRSITVIDLSEALEMEPVDYKNNISYVIVCEYNYLIHGFLINSPNTLINRSWEDVKSPSAIMSKTACLTALAYTDDGKTIQLLDVEKILAETIGVEEELSGDFQVNLEKEAVAINFKDYHLLVVDDSKAARMMLKSVMDKLGVTYTMMESAVNALQLLEDFSKGDVPITDRFAMIISDIEMPGMDGFTFTRKIKGDSRLSGLYIILHSSLSNKSNVSKAKQVGANDFLPKFRPDEIAGKILDRIHTIAGKN
ncbi:chemotaxis protein [Candidatus Magnetominusculus xianensis]|uniref:Chemotaxis protein CheW n=1 Tax=Candidatus Magnetominusculus xianensis TaxID=1748249 RepID=A0ABR5SMT1_9BACT|nr:chemotaxis protein [Candidatus Magnetominusculus xianensis]KWT92940.1 chemotaxis protein CheW [Candidatus Magnetominusculus xianensis]MBF0402944.1 chemotaxis protein CheV [Nitrospirota bacterium]